MQETDNNYDDYNRPRRPNPDTISYLRSLPLEEKSALEEIKLYVQSIKVGKSTIDTDNGESIDESNDNIDSKDQGDENHEYPQALSAAISAIEEIKNEVASLAGDEFGSQCLETLCRIGAPYSPLAARILLNGIKGYLLHLSTHRYGSHVVQTILQLAIHGNSGIMTGDDTDCILDLDEDEGDDDRENIPQFRDIILDLAEEILPFSSQLAVHVCGSHVLRTLICVLGGMEFESPSHISPGQFEGGGIRRGKYKAKKKKKNKASIHASDSPKNNQSSALAMGKVKRVVHSRIDTSDEIIRECLYSFARALTNGNFDSKTFSLNQNNDNPTKPGELQELLCHPSAGPLFIVLLRVFTYLDHFSNDPKYHIDEEQKYSKESHDLEQDQIDNNKIISDFRLGIQPSEPKFSPSSMGEALVHIFLCWDKGSNDAEQKYASDVIYGLSGEQRGSHLLECILRICHDHLFQSIGTAGGFFQSDSFDEYSKHDVSNFVIQTFLYNIRTRSQVENAIKCIEPLIGNGYLLNPRNKRRGILWRTVEMSANYRIGQETILKNLRKGFSCIKSGTESSGQTEDQDQDRTLMKLEHCIPELIGFVAPEKEGMRIQLDTAGTRTIYHLLRFVPRLCNETLSGIVNGFSAQELECIANDGLGSRCIFDAMLDGNADQKPFSTFIKKLFKKLSGKWVALSVQRVGHHLVRKLFLALESIKDKASLADELSKSINRLSGNAMGRLIIAECAVKDFMISEVEFEKCVKKQAENYNFLEDIAGSNSKGKGEDKARKRKRKKQVSANDSKMSNENSTLPTAEVSEDIISSTPALEEDENQKVTKKRKRKRKSHG